MATQFVEGAASKAAVEYARMMTIFVAASDKFNVQGMCIYVPYG